MDVKAIVMDVVQTFARKNECRILFSDEDETVLLPASPRVMRPLVSGKDHGICSGGITWMAFGF